MSRLRISLQTLLSNDVDALKPIIGPRLDQLDITDTTIDKSSIDYVTLAANESDYPVALGKVTQISALIIIAEQEITFKLGGVGQLAHTLRPTVADALGISTIQQANQPAIFILRGKVNGASVHLTNPSLTLTAKALVIVVGDAV